MARGMEAAASVAGQAEPEASITWNRRHIIAGQALQNAGDQVVKASTVLTWLLVALGSPASSAVASSGAWRTDPARP